MTNYAAHYSKRGPTPQSQAIPGREAEMTPNNAGGVVFQVDDWARLNRFLILGSEGGTYYVGERPLTIDNAQAVQRCIQKDGPRVVQTVVEISDQGRGAKNDPALFVLALCASDGNIHTRRAALAALPKVARIGTHLFHFAEYVNKQRGWGRALKRAIANWYLDRKDLPMQAIKYQQRDGWSHRDLLRLSHPKAKTHEDVAIFDWVCGRNKESEWLPPLITTFERLKKNPDANYAAELINSVGLPREAIPTELLNSVVVWQALLKNMPLTALIRNLGKMTSIGVIKPLSRELDTVVAALGNKEYIRKSRLHPLAILVALKTYAQGHGDKGSLHWVPVPQVIDALNEAFYLAFGNVEPSGKRIFMALDVSGSMRTTIQGTNITAREASATLALVTATVEKQYHIMGFSAANPYATSYRGMGGKWGPGEPGMTPVNITPRMRLDSVIKTIESIPMGGTDCSLPALYATRNELTVDGFVIYTDNETWHGAIHPSQALAAYRKKSGINARQAVVAMTPTQFTIADPNDPGQMDVVGFDTATPQVISDFIIGLS